MNDGALVIAVRSGNQGAYGQLVERYRGKIFGLCYRITANVPDAEDLAHESFVEAYIKLAQLRDAAKFGGWLRMVALNLCRAWYHRRAHAWMPLTDDLADAGSDDADGMAEQLTWGLAQLSPAHRLAIVLHHAEGLSYEDVAAFLAVPIGTVMSRLHRARKELKRIMKAMEENQDMTTPAPDFQREVDVEITSLLRMFGEDAGAVERLSVILDHSPERFAMLIRDSSGAEELDDLALVLRRLGQPGIDVTFDCCRSTDAELSAKARELLISLAASWCPGGNGKYLSRIAMRAAYRLIDTLIRSAWPDLDKAKLLLELMAATADPRTILLLRSALMCYPECAVRLLFERLRATASPEKMATPGNELYALCGLGSRFALMLIEMLQHGDRRECLIALSGAEGLARTLGGEWLDMADTGDDRIRLERRFRARWTPPLHADRNPDTLRALASAVAEYVSDDDASAPEWDNAAVRVRSDTSVSAALRVGVPAVPKDSQFRDLAVRTLGMLGDRADLPAIRVAAGHAVLSTRQAALRALADLGDAGCLPILLDATRSPDPFESRSAAEVIGCLQLEAGLDRLEEMLGDPNPQVRRAVVTAIGEVGGPRSVAILERLLKSTDTATVKAAAASLYGGGKRGKAHEGRIDDEPVGQPLRMLGNIVRDRSCPPFFIALDAAMWEIPSTEPRDEITFSRLIAPMCYDFACTRRFLVEEGLTRREGNVYHFTEIGETVWRVEQFLKREG